MCRLLVQPAAECFRSTARLFSILENAVWVYLVFFSRLEKRSLG
jgi:hypothetical protein